MVTFESKTQIGSYEVKVKRYTIERVNVKIVNIDPTEDRQRWLIEILGFESFYANEANSLETYLKLAIPNLTSHCVRWYEPSNLCPSVTHAPS